jgi:GAF domain-containing protein
MESDSTLDRAAAATSVVPAGKANGRANLEHGLEQKVDQGNGTRTSQASISSALAAANAGLHPTLASAVRFPGEDGGRSLAEMAQNDLDAALQLLADRAQYITGANGAAIALRRVGKNDMMCRASTGANVPELGALLSTEFGLSGESVRTRRALRCDDAERDPRVNREGCRELGIASVVVMPVVNDDEVMGVFELFSGKVNAFGERDLSALQRLSEMVETAVRLARAAESIAEPLNTAVGKVAEATGSGVLEEDVLDDDILGRETLEVQDPVLEVEAEAGAEELGAGVSGTEALTEEGSAILTLEAQRDPEADFSAKAGSAGNFEVVLEPPVVAHAPAPKPPVMVQSVVSPVIAPNKEPAPAPPIQATTPKKPLFWSAALSPAAETEKAAERDLSHVPPVLRNLRTCEACGFPVSPGRALCVECEEKKWRGQLKRPAAPLQNASSVVAPRASLPAENARNGAPDFVDAPSGPVARLVAAAAQSAAAAAPALARPGTSAAEMVSSAAAPATTVPDARAKESKEQVSELPPVTVGLNSPGRETVSTLLPETSEAPSPDFVLSAGLEPSQSWIAANKYIVGVLLVVAATVAAILFLR